MSTWTPEITEKTTTKTVVTEPTLVNRPEEGTLLKVTSGRSVVYGRIQPDYGHGPSAFSIDIEGTYTSLYVEIEKWDVEIIDESSSD